MMSTEMLNFVSAAIGANDPLGNQHTEILRVLSPTSKLSPHSLKTGWFPCLLGSAEPHHCVAFQCRPLRIVNLRLLLQVEVY